MKKRLYFFILLAISLSSIAAFAQDNSLLQKVPRTKEEFISSEPQVIATINWIENTPLNEQTDKRKELYKLLIIWMTESPTVTLEIDAKIMDFTTENPDLMFLYMAGWTKYCLEHSYDKDLLQGNLAGIRSAIKMYKKGVNMKKSKSMQQMIAREDSGELESWVRKQLASAQK